METVQVQLPLDTYRKLVAEAARQGKPAWLVAQEWLIERATATMDQSAVDEQALAVLRAAGLLAELSPDEQARAAASTTTLAEVQEALSRSGGQPLSALIIEQRGSKA